MKKIGKIEKTFKFGGKDITLSTGHFAGQATGAVMVTCGETVVMATVVSVPIREDRGYFPLSVDYKVRLSAGGRIKGSRWVKRDGRPTDDEILNGRLIDRSIRPLFASNYENEVQVIVQVLAIDGLTPPNMLGGIAVSAAIEASEIPWSGPMAMSRVGMKDGKFITNPGTQDLEASDLDLVVSTASGAIVMVEAGANIISEDKMADAIAHAEKENKKLTKVYKEFAKEVGIKKEAQEKVEVNLKLEKEIEKLVGDKMDGLVVDMATKKATYADFDKVKAEVKEEVGEEDKEEAGKVFEKLFERKVKKIILSGKRPDGRKHDELRNLDSQVSVLPRVHGSALFLRGETQALTVATLGAPSLSQLIESAEGEETKSYIHHYAMPPYSVGEAGRFGFPGRREIGHGALAERALKPVLPSKEDFPYTIYILTEILSSNGSTSMAATCGSTLSLMDAGVPIKAPVAGIAMGLVIESKDKFAVLTDIVGMEDGNGDMDIKVAGTKEGITALQMDVKTLNLTVDILRKAFVQAKKARLEILAVMEKAIDAPRKSVGKYAPKIESTEIPQDKIGELIGPGGKSIKKLMADTGTQIDVNDDGLVSVSGEDMDKVKEALEWIDSLAKEVLPGELYKGEVVRIEAYGAFVNILPNKDGLVHVSSMSEEFVSDPNTIVKLGDKVEVRVKKIDERGRIDLSMILDPSKEKDNGNRGGSRGPRGSGGERSPRRFDRGGREADRGRRNDRRGPRSNNRNRNSSPDRPSGGPHFPTSRLMEEK